MGHTTSCCSQSPPVCRRLRACVRACVRECVRACVRACAHSCAGLSSVHARLGSRAENGNPAAGFPITPALPPGRWQAGADPAPRAVHAWVVSSARTQRVLSIGAIARPSSARLGASFRKAPRGQRLARRAARKEAEARGGAADRRWRSRRRARTQSRPPRQPCAAPGQRRGSAPPSRGPGSRPAAGRGRRPSPRRGAPGARPSSAFSLSMESSA